MDIFDEFATDEKLELEGRWVDYDEKTSFLIARASNKNFGKMFTREFDKLKGVMATKGDAAEAASEKLIIQTTAATVLLGWRGPVKLQGVELEYSTANAEKILAFKEFRKWVQTHSENFEAYRAGQEAEQAKN